jgi:hypothetical protein
VRAASRPGNRKPTARAVSGLPGNRLPGALDDPARIRALAAAQEVKQASDDTQVTALADLTDGLDVSNIQFKLEDYEDRIDALEAGSGA